MRENRQIPAHRHIDLCLARGIVQVIIAPNHMGHAHIVIVHDNRQHIRGRAVPAQKHHVIKLVVAHRHVALNRVARHRHAVTRGLQADDIRQVGEGGRGRIPPRALKQGGAPVFFRRLPKGLDFVLARETLIRRPAVQHRMGHLGVPIRARELANGIAVPIEAKPVQPRIDRRRRLRGGARPVRILYPQQKRAAVCARI